VPFDPGRKDGFCVGEPSSASELLGSQGRPPPVEKEGSKTSHRASVVGEEIQNRATDHSSVFSEKLKKTQSTTHEDKICAA